MDKGGGAGGGGAELGVLDVDALLRGNRSWRRDWEFDPRQGDGHLGHDRKNGAGFRDRANRVYTFGAGACARIVGRAGHLDVGDGSDFFGALPALAAGDYAEHAVWTVPAADTAEYDGR